MKNITREFTTLHEPVKAMLFYRSNKKVNDFYVEAYDVNGSGKLIDPHPLSLAESQELAENLLTTERLTDRYLQPKGLLPQHILHTHTGQNGFALWYTPPMRRQMLFISSLGLNEGSYALPGLIWKADRNHISIFAIKQTSRPTLSSQLYHAPFFNVYESGNVCMGTVNIDIDQYSCLETFISQWETYFFRSKFSHVVEGSSPIKGNIIQVYKSLLNNNKKFPVACLQKHRCTLKNLIA